MVILAIDDLLHHTCKKCGSENYVFRHNVDIENLVNPNQMYFKCLDCGEIECLT